MKNKLILFFNDVSRRSKTLNESKKLNFWNKVKDSRKLILIMITILWLLFFLSFDAFAEEDIYKDLTEQEAKERWIAVIASVIIFSITGISITFIINLFK